MLSKSFNEVFTGGTGVLDYSSVTLLKTSQTESMKKKEKEEKEKTRKKEKSG